MIKMSPPKGPILNYPTVIEEFKYMLKKVHLEVEQKTKNLEKEFYQM